jgi:SAM-dependent methyltransferase
MPCLRLTRPHIDQAGQRVTGSPAPSRTFWEERLGQDWTLSGVGYQALGRPFNTWMYRVRRAVFLREVAAMHLPLPSARVLDVGSGTGFYIRRWQELGAGSITGCDLTQSAVDRLARRHPEVPFLQLDISAPLTSLERGSFDVVSCMDVLFHITDDAQYRSAVANIAALLRPGGHFILSENFLHRAEQRGQRQVNHSLTHIEEVLDAAGLQVLRRVPMLVLMNAQVDAPPLWRKSWGAALRLATLTDATGWLAGALLYPLERQLVRRVRESPTTELMICRRRATG